LVASICLLRELSSARRGRNALKLFELRRRLGGERESERQKVGGGIDLENAQGRSCSSAWKIAIVVKR